jgi:predicted DNA repair protein MutK
MLLSNGANLVLGFIIGSIVLLVVNLIARVRGKSV